MSDNKKPFNPDDYLELDFETGDESTDEKPEKETTDWNLLQHLAEEMARTQSGVEATMKDISRIIGGRLQLEGGSATLEANQLPHGITFHYSGFGARLVDKENDQDISIVPSTHKNLKLTNNKTDESSTITFLKVEGMTYASFEIGTDEALIVKEFPMAIIGLTSVNKSTINVETFALDNEDEITLGREEDVQKDIRRSKREIIDTDKAYRERMDKLRYPRKED